VDARAVSASCSFIAAPSSYRNVLRAAADVRLVTPHVQDVTRRFVTHLYRTSTHDQENIMGTFKRKLAGLGLGCGLSLALGLGFAAQANATTVGLTTDGLWHTFDVDSLSATSGGLEWIDYADGSALSFQINNAAPVLLTVVDGGFSGDRFSVLDNGVQLGQTSVVLNSYPNSIGLDFDSAVAAAAFYSKGGFLLAPGSHTITGSLLESAVDDVGNPLNATVGAVMLQAVPEPAQWATLAAGLFLLSFSAQRSRRK
jgi:hypothetical protein